MNLRLKCDPLLGKSIQKRFIQNGFTMIELVVVLVTMGILAVAGSSLFFNSSTYTRQLYFTEVLNSLRYAQKLAIANGCHIRVSNNPTNAITLELRLTGTNCTSGTTYVPISDPSTGKTPYSKIAPQGVTITPSANWPFYFDPDGRAVQVSSSTVGNFSVTVGGKVINIVGETGFVNDPSS